MTEEEEANITMFMRVIEFMRKHPVQMEQIPELKTTTEKLKAGVANIIELLTDEERDTILERYKDEMEYLNEQK